MGDHIRKRRLDLKLLQKDVAEILGVDTTTVTNWEKNRCGPSLQLIPKVIQFLGNNLSATATIIEPVLGARIKACRRMLGISQKCLARKLAIDPTTLARWESGKSKPGTKLRKLLNDFLLTSSRGGKGAQ